MRGVTVAVVALALGMNLVSLGSAGPSPDATDPFAWAPYPEGTAGYESNVDAWVDYYLDVTGDELVPDETVHTIQSVSRYSGPVHETERQGPVDDTPPVAAHVGFMYFECSISNPGCFVEDWWGNMGGPCNGWDVPQVPGYTQNDGEMTMAEWGNGFVQTYTEDHYELHFSSLIDGAILNGYLCQGQIGNRLVALFSGWGVFDNRFLVDPAPPIWQTVPLQVGPPPPPYDHLGPPFCPTSQGVQFCWTPEDLTPQPPATGQLRPR